MDLRNLTDAYAVAGQLKPEEVADLPGIGVTTLVCNRPDNENPEHLQSAAIAAAAEAAGIRFVYNPVIGTGMSAESIDIQAEAIDTSDGMVLAYCASGMRSALMWSFAKAGEIETADILRVVREAGFALDHLHGQLDGIGARRRA